MRLLNLNTHSITWLPPCRHRLPLHTDSQHLTHFQDGAQRQSSVMRLLGKHLNITRTRSDFIKTLTSPQDNIHVVVFCHFGKTFDANTVVVMLQMLKLQCVSWVYKSCSYLQWNCHFHPFLKSRQGPNKMFPGVTFKFHRKICNFCSSPPSLRGKRIRKTGCWLHEDAAFPTFAPLCFTVARKI